MVASVRCPYCHGAIHPGDRHCGACGAGAPLPPTAVERAVGVAVPRLRFGWTVVAVMAGSLALGGLAGSLGEEPPVLVMLVVLGWVFPSMPVILIWSAVRDARALRKSWLPGIAISLAVWVVSFFLLFVPMLETATG